MADTGTAATGATDRSGGAPAPDATLELELPATVGPDAAAKLAKALREAGPARRVIIDASAVEAVSTPFVLTMLSAMQSRNGAPGLTLAQPSAAFMDAYTDLGLFGELMKMEFA